MPQPSAPLAVTPAHGSNVTEGAVADRRPDGRGESTWASVPSRDRVLVAAGLLVLVQLAFRAWALFPSWFYTDDYRFLHDATGAELDLDYLITPFDSQFMPLGRALVWLVADSGHVNWTLAAGSTLLMQALASVACVWMLTTLFGARWEALALLALYLFGAMTLPALMWWAAALNQIPLQAALFASVACWVRYLRGDGLRWLAFTLIVLALGLLAYVKTVLVFGVLAYLLLAYFAEGGPIRRTWSAVRRFWPAAVGAVALGAGYTAYYVTQVPSIFADADRPLAGSLAEHMLGTSLVTGLVGGPWQWDTSNPPVAQAAPPDWATHAAWVACAVVVSVILLRRERAGRALVLFCGYAALAYLLVLTSRAPVIGGDIGREYRYLTDTAAMVPLCLGLATLGMPGAPGSSAPRRRPLLLLAPGKGVVVSAVTLVCASALLSSRAYALVWHQDHPGADFTQRVIDSFGNRTSADLADQVVPPEVIPGYSSPYNLTSRLVPLLVDDPRFPTTSARLSVLRGDGSLRPAEVDAVAESRPGPDEDCGWEVAESATTVALDARTFDYAWWVEIDYLASTDTEMAARMGDTQRTLPLRQGLHTLWTRADGELSSLTFGDLSVEGARVCIDRVRVGLLDPDLELEP
ncbi:hypothetical protein [Nocardioides ferulae]|uniref:hypothetical protein n=1 Tax=Nocardioides ferulae TaxID=2340821 RepID=UPI000EAC2EDC|nr:hypothetical protein [Nocardioides ferulae]